jgi:cytochrome bd-type quinol oxidase subunit 2
MIADTSWTYLIPSRWLHVICACLVVGGTYFFAVVPSEAGQPRGRRAFKMTVHVSTLFLLLTGIANAMWNWNAYRHNVPLTHALFGPHLLLGLASLAILMVLLARKTPAISERKWLAITIVLLFLAVLMASSLKYAREHPKSDLSTPLRSQSGTG